MSSLRRMAALLSLLAIGSAAYFVQGAGANQASRFDLVRAMVEQHSLRIDAFAANTVDKAFFDGHFYSDKAPGLSFASVIPYAFARMMGWPRSLPGMLHALTLAVVGVPSALAAPALFLVAVAMGVRRSLAALATCGWLLGTNAFAYGTMYYAHQEVASLLFLSFALLYAAKGQGPLASRPWVVALAGLLGSWAAISEYPAAVCGPLLFAYGARTLSLRRMIPFALGALPPLALLLLYNAEAFGTPFAMSYTHFASGEIRNRIDQGVFGVGLPRREALYGSIFGQWRGLLPLAPFTILALPGAWRAAGRPSLRADAWIALAVNCYFVLLVAGFYNWPGGASLGPRYLVPMLPFTALLAAIGMEWLALAQAPFGRWAELGCAALVVVSVVSCTMAVAVMPELPDVAIPVRPAPDVAPPDMLHRPLTTFVVPMFMHAHLSAKGIAPSGAMTFASLLPEEHGMDAFNLGEAAGLGGLWSLVPLAAFWAAVATALAALSRTERSRAAA